MPASSRGDDALQMMAAILFDPDAFDPPPPPPPATIAETLRGLHSGETRLSDVHDSITQFLQDLYSGETSLPDVFVSELLELVDGCFSNMSGTDLKGADQARRAALWASVKFFLHLFSASQLDCSEICGSSGSVLDYFALAARNLEPTYGRTDLAQLNDGQVQALVASEFNSNPAQQALAEIIKRKGGVLHDNRTASMVAGGGTGASGCIARPTTSLFSTMELLVSHGSLLQFEQGETEWGGTQPIQLLPPLTTDEEGARRNPRGAPRRGERAVQPGRRAGAARLPPGASGHAARRVPYGLRDASRHEAPPGWELMRAAERAQRGTQWESSGSLWHHGYCVCCMANCRCPRHPCRM